MVHFYLLRSGKVFLSLMLLLGVIWLAVVLAVALVVVLVVVLAVA